MRVNDITTTNLHIMQGIAKDYSKLPSLPADIGSILKRVVIRYELDGVNPFELISLQKIGCVSSIEPIGSRYDNFMDFLEVTGFKPETTADEMLLQKVISMNDYMARHGHDEYGVVRKCGPIGIQQYQCNVVLTGSSILNLYGYKFNEIFEKDENDEMTLESFIEAKLIAGIMNATYSTFQNTITSKDIYTNAWYYENYYKGRNKDYTLMSIFDNTGCNLKFVDTTPEELTESIRLAKENRCRYHNREWTIEVVCDTPVYLYFFYLFTNLGRDHKFNIVNTEDTMILLGKERRKFDPTPSTIEEEIMTFSKTLYNYDEFFDSCMENEKFDMFSRFLYAPANGKIRFTMQLKWYPGIADDCKESFHTKYRGSEEMNLVNNLHQVNLVITKNELFE